MLILHTLLKIKQFECLSNIIVSLIYIVLTKTLKSFDDRQIEYGVIPLFSVIIFINLSSSHIKFILLLNIECMLIFLLSESIFLIIILQIVVLNCVIAITSFLKFSLEPFLFHGLH